MRVLPALLVLALAAAGCGSEAALPDPGPAAEPRGETVTLYVSNQSFDRPKVDIRVEIDGRVVVADDFAVENQHNWVEFRLRLRPGEHVLRATTQAGDATLERSFTVAGQRWAVLDYWCCEHGNEPHFTFDVSKRRIAFA